MMDYLVTESFERGLVKGVAYRYPNTASERN